MPALRKTDQQRRDIAFVEALARGKAGKALSDAEIADAVGMNSCTLSIYRSKGPWKMEFERFCKLARKVGMTGKELCRIAGIPYRCEDEDAQVTSRAR